MTDHEQRELLRRFRPWLYTVAKGIVPEPSLIEDYMQEGWIAIWREVQKGIEDDLWFKQAAICKMRNCARNDTRECRDIRRTIRADDCNWDTFVTDLGSIELAYHYGEIAEAINGLTSKQRDYVLGKYWQGFSHAELKEMFAGNKPGGIWARAKVTLKKELAHLGAD
jgi:DNA-directed RNA polymerase specialized sigma24 family protein